MALRDQPYFPLYVKDFTTDEKLKECDAGAHGVFILLMCLMHRSKTYGKVLLEQKYLQKYLQKYQQTSLQRIQQTSLQKSSICSDFVGAFAEKFVKHLPFTLLEIENGLCQLIENDVIQIDGNYLSQKRMVKDGDISDKRASAGRKSASGKGGAKNFKKKFVDNFVPTKLPTKSQQNTAYAIAIENVIENVKDNEGVIGNKWGVQGVEESGGEEGSENFIAEVENHLTNLSFEVGEFLEVYFKSPKYSVVREQLASANYMDLEMLQEWGKAFNIYLITSGTDLNTDGKTVKQESDWSKHFKFWLARQDRNKNPRELHTENHTKNGKKTSSNGEKNFNENYKRELLAKMAPNKR